MTITAPAGFGKTTLLTDWVESRGAAAAWLTLDASDNDLPRFVDHLVAALRLQDPTFGIGALAMFDASPSTSVSALVTGFGNAALDLAGPVTLVIDDAHLLVDPAPLAFLDALLLHPTPPLRLVLAGRNDLPLSLAVARGRGTLVDIDTADLRFREDEIAEFLERTLEETFPPAFVSAVAARTDGWAACLRLVTTAIFQHSDRPQFESALLDGASTGIMEFLTDEVLANILPSTRAFLLRTAVCDRVCVDLATAMLDGDPTQPDSQSVLDEMIRQDIYVSRMGHDGVWYTFHPLFREILLDALVTEVGRDGVARQHRRASDWFALHGLTEDAIRHALLAGEDQRAADVAADAGFRCIDAERWNELPGLLSLLPHELVASRADLVVLRCWRAWNHGAIDHIGRDLAVAERLLAEAPLTSPGRSTLVAGHIATLRTIADLPDPDPDMVLAATRRALDLLADSGVVARGFALQVTCPILALAGRAEEAARLVDPYAGASLYAQTGLVARARLARASIRLLAAYDLDDAMADNTSALAIAIAEQMLVTANASRSNIAAISLCRLDLATARRLSTDILESGPAATRHAWRDAMGILAITAALDGDHDRALDLAHEMVGSLETTGSITALPSARSLQARVHLLTGQVDAALAWATNVGSEVDADLPMYLDSQAVTRASALLAAGSRGSTQLAFEHLERLLALTRRRRHAPLATRALAVHALALDALGRRDEAVAALDAPLAHATRHGAVLSFIEPGNAMADLLDAIADTHPQHATIERLRARIRLDRPAVIAANQGSTTDERDLTLRELEILGFLTTRMSNKEIAGSLHISPLTVKRHVSHIIAKLEANDRRHAIDRARERGLV